MSDGRIIKGQTSAEQLPDLEFIPNQGMRTIMRRDFADYNSARAYAAALFNDKVRTSVRQKGDAPIWTVESSYEGDPNDPESDIQNTHELRVNILYSDIKSNLHLQSQFTGSAPAACAAVERFADEVKSGDKTYDQAIQAIADSDDIETADLSVATQMLDLFLLGVESYPQFQYVYTHTFNFGDPQDFTLDNSNVFEIHSTGHVESDESIPASFGLPAGEWLKLPPEKTTYVGGRASIKYEYWWAEQYSTLLYPHAG